MVRARLAQAFGRLIRREGDKVTLRPIAGTRKRGSTPEKDLEMERELFYGRTEAAKARAQGYSNTNSGLIKGMAGAAGLVVSATNSWYVFLKLAKLWERRRRAESRACSGRGRR